MKTPKTELQNRLNCLRIKMNSSNPDWKMVVITEKIPLALIPSDIYRAIINNLSPDFLENFMGFGNRKVKFLGHGIGLFIDEVPVIAEGFNEPLQEGMVFAIEPKKGIEDIGMVGIENTFLVTSKGGHCITGDHPGLIPVF